MLRILQYTLTYSMKHDSKSSITKGKTLFFGSMAFKLFYFQYISVSFLCNTFLIVKNRLLPQALFKIFNLLINNEHPLENDSAKTLQSRHSF